MCFGGSFHNFAVILGIAALNLACGQQRLVPAPRLPEEKTISIKVLNYCQTEGFVLDELFSFNASAPLVGKHHLPDYDRDGLHDAAEFDLNEMTTFNISAKNADTNGDGYSDLVVRLIGYDSKTQSNLRDCPLVNQDTDYDLLTDCEEWALRTDPLHPDSDRDGIPDGYEIRFGTNPNDGFDAFLDFDQDTLTNLHEIKSNLPVKSTNGHLAARAYRYKVEPNEFPDCFNLTIGNIPLTEVENGNLIHVHLLETKQLIGQGDVVRLRTARVALPQDRLEKHSRIVFDGLSHQTVDGVAIPWIVEDGRED
jgi:hypothetical protein